MFLPLCHHLQYNIVVHVLYVILQYDIVVHVLYVILSVNNACIHVCLECRASWVRVPSEAARFS